MGAEPAPLERRRLPRGAGRKALLEAIIRLVAREGLASLTFRAAAAEAGVTHGLASYHFRSRETMIEEALAWATERDIEAARLEPASGRLEDFAADLPELVSANPERPAFQFELALEARRRRELLPQVRLLYEHYIDVVARSLEEAGVGGDRVLARLAFAALDGLVLQQLIFDDPDATEQAVARLRHLLAASQ